MIIYFNNTSVDLLVSDNSCRSRQIMGENSLTLYIALADYIDIPIGAYCRYVLHLEGGASVLNKLLNFEHVLFYAKTEISAIGTGCHDGSVWNFKI